MKYKTSLCLAAVLAAALVWAGPASAQVITWMATPGSSCTRNPQAANAVVTDGRFISSVFDGTTEAWCSVMDTDANPANGVIEIWVHGYDGSPSDPVVFVGRMDDANSPSYYELAYTAGSVAYVGAISDWVTLPAQWGDAATAYWSRGVRIFMGGNSRVDRVINRWR